MQTTHGRDGSGVGRAGIVRACTRRRPAEIEIELRQHPSVHDCAVIGVPNAEWGEEVKAVVQLHEAASASEEEIRAFLEQRLADYKRPRSIDFVAELPYNPSGKLLKKELRQRYWEGSGREIGSRMPGRGRVGPAGLAGRTLFVASCLLASACGSPRPVSTFTLAVRSPDVVRARVLQRDVEGEWCFTQSLIAATLRPPWRARLADRGRAVENALEKVRGANVLTDATLSVRVEQYLLFQRVCSLVTGDAGALQ